MKRKKVKETVGGEPYEYFPLGKFIVSAPGVCRGRPTFKYTRIEVAGLLDLLGAGYPINKVVKNYQGRVPRDAVLEAIDLAAKAFSKQMVRASSR
jgi:uncharacterized protein (DUF433 family)